MFYLNSNTCYIDLHINQILNKKCTPAPVANIINQNGPLPAKPRRLRTSGTSSLLIGYSFTEKKYDGVKVRPQSLSINEEFNDDTQCDETNKSNVYAVQNTLRFLNKNVKMCEVSYPTSSTDSNDSKSIKDQSTKPSVPLLQDRPSDEFENDDIINNDNLSLKRKKERNKIEREKRRQNCK